jgi:hypothetical protein
MERTIRAGSVGAGSGGVDETEDGVHIGSV